jgi:hypothetical protein
MRKQESNRGYHSVVFVAWEAAGIREEGVGIWNDSNRHELPWPLSEYAENQGI